MRRTNDTPAFDIDDASGTPPVSLPGFAEWERRHAETKRVARSDESARTVRVPTGTTAVRQGAEFEARHGRCSRE